MRTTKVALQFAAFTGVAALAIGLAAAAPPPAPGKPVMAFKQLPRRLVAADIRIPKADVQSIIDKVTGQITSECTGAKDALAAYNTCKDKCSQDAQNSPITPAELEKCGNQSAADCAAMLIATRARACINSPAPAGCKDAFAKLQLENAECKTCNDLKTFADKAVDATEAQAKVVAQAEAALQQARAQLDALEARAAALNARAQRACAAAKK